MKLTPIMKSLALAGIISTLPMTSWAETSPKAAAAATKQANDALYKQLPFSDNTDFTNAHKGFIAALPTEVIKGEQATLSGTRSSTTLLKRVKRRRIRSTPASGVNPS